MYFEGDPYLESDRFFSNRIGAKGFGCCQVIAANLGDGAGVEIGGV
jgi:hypothetical protein